MMIVDASVGVKWIRDDEKDADKANLLLKSHLENYQQITVPPLFLYEIANILVHKTGVSSSSIKNGLQVIYKAKNITTS